VAQRILVCPPDCDERKVAPDAQLVRADALAFDEDLPERARSVGAHRPVQLPLRPGPDASHPFETEWVSPTSGTSAGCPHPEDLTRRDQDGA